MAYIRSRKHANPSHLLALVAAALPVAAAAQEAEQLLPATTVTAEAESSYKADYAASKKFTAPLVDTPKTVTVVTQEVLEQTNAGSLKEALRTVTGITFGMGEGGSPEGDNPIIRGFNAQASTYIDGLHDPSSQSRNMFAVEQVDVVKGADSAFSGGGAVGGSINLTTKSAKLGNFGEASAGLGTDGYYRTTVDLNRQFSETGALRINLLKEAGDVPGRDSVDYDHLGANVSAAFGLGTATRVTVGLYHYQTDDMPDYGVPYNNPYTAGTANAVYNGDGSPLNVDRDSFYGLTGRDFRKTTVDSGTVKFEHDLNDKWTVRNALRVSSTLNDYVASNPGDTSGVNLTPGSITSSGVVVPSGYLRRSAKSRHSDTDGVINSTDLNGEFMTGTVKHNVAAGFEASHLETDSRGYTVTGGSVASIYDPNPGDVWTGTVTRTNTGTKYNTTTRGLYVFDTLTLTRQWLVNVGVREDWFSTKANTYSTNGFATNSTTTAFVPASARSDVSFTSYQGGLVFKPRDNGSIYLNYATAANPSGITGGDGTDNLGTSGATLSYADLEPEKIRNVELGTKWNLFGNRLSLTGSIFKLDKTNAKVQVDASTYETVGRQETKGFELGFAGALTDRWQVFGGYTHLDSKLAEVGPYASNQVIKGKRFPNTPEHSFSLWSTYKLQPKLTVGGGAYYVSKVYGNTANTKWVPEYWLFDAMASYEFNRQLSVRVNVTNLLDETYYDRAYTTHMVSVGAGRQAIATVNYKF